MMYYVYILIDSETNVPFYVGKGTGNRIYAHERCVRRGKVPHGNSYLFEKISKILAGGFFIGRRKVFVSEDEVACYDEEERLIKKYGIENLCNLASGGRQGNKETRNLQSQSGISYWKSLSPEEKVIRVEKMRKGRHGA